MPFDLGLPQPPMCGGCSTVDVPPVIFTATVPFITVMEGAGHTEGYAVVAGWCMSVDVCMCVYELASSFNQQHPYTTVTGSKQCV